MGNEIRWIALFAILGFFAAFVLWGSPHAPTPPASAPVQATGVPSTSQAHVPAAAQKNAEPPPPHGGTELTFDPDSVDLGTVPLNESRTVDLRVQNPTDKTITMRELTGSCGCLQVTSDTKEIAPRASIPIHLQFTGVQGRKNAVVRACFRTDEKSDPFVTVDVHAKVKEEILIEPYSVNFDSVKKNEARTREFTLRSDDGKPFEIKSIAGSRSEVTYKWEATPGKDNSVYTVRATLKGDKGGMVADAAAVITDRPMHGTVALHATGTIEHDLKCVPSILNADMDDARNVAAFSAVIKRTTPGRLEITSAADASRKPLPVDFVIDRIDEETCRVSIKFKEPYPKRAPYGQFAIKTNVEEAEYFAPYRINAGKRLAPPPKVKP